ncbi:MAG: beta-galactosidase [Chthoniobacterales bacterium]
MEPSEGVYKWTLLESEMARAAAAGKMVLLRINTHFAKPDWVIDGRPPPEAPVEISRTGPF